MRQDIQICLEIAQFKNLSTVSLDVSFKQFLIKAKLLHSHSHHQQRTKRVSLNSFANWQPFEETGDSGRTNIPHKNKQSLKPKQNTQQYEISFNEAFYYSTEGLDDDTVELSLIGLKNQSLDLKSELVHKKYKAEEFLIGKAVISLSKVRKVAETRYRDYQLKLLLDQKQVGRLFLNVSYYEGQKIIGAACAPNLSLLPDDLLIKKISDRIKVPQQQSINNIAQNQPMNEGFFSCIGCQNNGWTWQLFSDRYHNSQTL